MGHSGIVVRKSFLLFFSRDVPVCDSCAGVERDLNGYAWSPDETEHTYAKDIREDGTLVDPETVTREQAFGRQSPPPPVSVPPSRDN
jgi:hypothetical protein